MPDPIYDQPLRRSPARQNRLPRKPSQLMSSCYPKLDIFNCRLSAAVVTWLWLICAGIMLTGIIQRVAENQPLAPPLIWCGIYLFCHHLRILFRNVQHRLKAIKANREILILCAVSFCLLTIPLPFTVHLLVNAAAVFVLVWQFSEHCISATLTSPESREHRNQLRQSWRHYLAATLLGAFGICGAALLAGNETLFWCVTGCVFVHLASPLLRNTRTHLTLCVESMAFWLAYNRFDIRVPGVFFSPAGKFTDRFLLTGACVSLTSITLLHWPDSWTPRVIPEIESPFPPAAVYFLREIFPADSSDFGFAKFVTSVIGFGIVIFSPLLVVLMIPPLMTLRILIEARQHRVKTIQGDRWKPVVRAMQSSSDPIERDSLYMGRIVCDGSPLLIPRDVFHEHAHFLGDSGSGKTSMGLAPWMEQMIGYRDCSVVIVDLKADSHELLATAVAAAKERSRQTGRDVPVRHFSNQAGLSTFAFNPLLQPWFHAMDHYVRTDILCGALGLTYGSDYGEGFYSSANAAVSYHTIKKHPETVTFSELANRLAEVAIASDKRELHPEIRKAGVHVQTVLDRLGSFEALNVTRQTHADEVVDSAVDFCDVFTRPQVLYFHLSATLGPGSSPEIARLVAYSLLAASTQTERKHQVFLVVDEFQRMVARNIEYMLQLARSMGVGVIIANQSMQDLKTSKADLIPTIEANCRYRQWFSASSHEDREMIVKGSGEMIDELQGQAETPSRLLGSLTNQTSQFIRPRLTQNDVMFASDLQTFNIVRLSRGAGYAQYGGLPVLAETHFHISQDEYERRKQFAWPEAANGAFMPGSRTTEPFVSQTKPGPVASTEIIGGPADGAAASTLLDSWVQENQAADPTTTRVQKH